MLPALGHATVGFSRNGAYNAFTLKNVVGQVMWCVQQLTGGLSEQQNWRQAKGNAVQHDKALGGVKRDSEIWRRRKGSVQQVGRVGRLINSAYIGKKAYKGVRRE